MFASTTTVLLYPSLSCSVCSSAKLHLISFSNSQLDRERSSHCLSDDRENCKHKNQGYVCFVSAVCFHSAHAHTSPEGWCLAWVSVDMTVTLLDDFVEKPACSLQHIKGRKAA